MRVCVKGARAELPHFYLVCLHLRHYGALVCRAYPSALRRGGSLTFASPSVPLSQTSFSRTTYDSVSVKHVASRDGRPSPDPRAPPRTPPPNTLSCHPRPLSNPVRAPDRDVVAHRPRSPRELGRRRGTSRTSLRCRPLPVLPPVLPTPRAVAASRWGRRRRRCALQARWTCHVHRSRQRPHLPLWGLGRVQVP